MNLSFCIYMFYEKLNYFNDFKRMIHIHYMRLYITCTSRINILYSVVNTGRVKYPRIVYPRVG